MRVPTFPQSSLEDSLAAWRLSGVQFAKHRASRPDPQPTELSSSSTPHMHLIYRMRVPRPAGLLHSHCEDQG